MEEEHRSSQIEGSVGTLSDIPITFAPNWESHNESHDPLNPVCPVTKTFKFLYLSFQLAISSLLLTLEVQLSTAVFNPPFFR